ncbi:heterocyst differentiation protein HetZ [Leptolyngbya sp. 'hensonii']|uniref:heterocyst differentiation protein HetZ n=1 Tax=Leptolyngbya sp. 'hensonii' TaxID=1922337 RepID=UPI000A702383|nr:heterocyst differentiation protein HetZ [Leptolyngbya sp. 'hensonii']
MEAIFQLLFNELKQSTKATEKSCRMVAERLASEVSRICSESKRIQDSGQVDSWAVTLARHRLKQCLTYYKLGSRRGRVELHSTLSAVVYRYITPPHVQSSYQARLTLIEDFLQGFYIEALNAFRREAQLTADYTPKTLLDLAEYMAFSERYAKRRIPLPGRRNQQLIILRAQTFSQQQPAEIFVDIEQAAEGSGSEPDHIWNAASLQRVREQMVAQDLEPAEDSLRHNVVADLMAYLEERQQNDCADYFALRLQDLSANEIEAVLGLTPRQRDYLQQRFKYHLVRFALSHRWELVHQWLEADLDHNLGLTSHQWQTFQARISQQQLSLLRMKQQGVPDLAIAQDLGFTTTQVQKQWSKLLEQAWEIRNGAMSGSGISTDE